MQKFKIHLLLFLLSMTIQTFSQKSSIESDIQELLDITHCKENYLRNADSLIENYQKQDTLKLIPKAYWDEFKKELANSYFELDSALIQIYAKYYTQEEIKWLIQFNKTRLGQKIIEVTPRIAAESYDAGNKIGLEISEKILEKLIKKDTPKHNEEIKKKKKNHFKMHLPGWYTRYLDKRRFKKGRF